MSYKPPFKITTKIIDLISKISLNIERLKNIPKYHQDKKVNFLIENSHFKREYKNTSKIQM